MTGIPEINCRVPITVRISGELTDRELEQLGDMLTSTLEARLAFAEQEMASRQVGLGGASDLDMVREDYDSARLGSVAYCVPSYQGRGQRTPIPVHGAATGTRGLWFVRKATNFRARIGDYL